MVKKNPDKESYLESRKWLLEAYDVAAATRPAACGTRVVVKDDVSVGQDSPVKAPAPSIPPGKALR